MKPEPGVAVTPGRVSSRSGSNPSRTQRLADAHSAFDSPTLELSNATLASSGAQNLQKKIFTEFEGSNRLADVATLASSL